MSEPFTCFDCKYGLPRYEHSAHQVECMILERDIEESSLCQVSLKGLQAEINRRARADRIVDLEEALAEVESLDWDRSDWRREMRLEDELRAVRNEPDFAKVLVYLWGKSTAPTKWCPHCDFIALDSQAFDCPVHKIPLRLGDPPRHR